MNTTTIEIPWRGRGRPSAKSRATYQRRLCEFADQILEIRSGLEFSPSARGWCYTLEDYGLLKGNFNRAQDLITELRLNGMLPLNITAPDGTRDFDCIEALDYSDASREAEWIRGEVFRLIDGWRPFSFWDDKDVYLEMVVEKVDLKLLFAPICRRYGIPIANAKGWSDVHLRAASVLRCMPHIQAGRRVVLLYCGDHDPAGINISNTLETNLVALNGTRIDHQLDDPKDNRVTQIEIGEGDIVVDRFGLNIDFIEAMGLTWIDNLITGSGNNLASPKHADYEKPYVQDYLHMFGARKVEANSLVARPNEARELCEQTVLKYVDASAVGQYEAELETRRVELRKKISVSVRK